MWRARGKSRHSLCGGYNSGFHALVIGIHLRILAMDLRSSIADWNEDDVQLFLSGLGYSQYESQIRGKSLIGLIVLLLPNPIIRPL